jgi:hypothetical protein
MNLLLPSSRYKCRLSKVSASSISFKTPCDPLNVNRRFTGSAYNLLHTGLLLGLFLDPEDGSDIFLRKIG